MSSTKAFFEGVAYLGYALTGTGTTPAETEAMGKAVAAHLCDGHEDANADLALKTYQQAAGMKLTTQDAYERALRMFGENKDEFFTHRSSVVKVIKDLAQSDSTNDRAEKPFIMRFYSDTDLMRV